MSESETQESLSQKEVKKSEYLKKLKPSNITEVRNTFLEVHEKHIDSSQSYYSALSKYNFTID